MAGAQWPWHSGLGTVAVAQWPGRSGRGVAVSQWRGDETVIARRARGKKTRRVRERDVGARYSAEARWMAHRGKGGLQRCLPSVARAACAALWFIAWTVSISVMIHPLKCGGV